MQRLEFTRRSSRIVALASSGIVSLCVTLFSPLLLSEVLLFEVLAQDLVIALPERNPLRVERAVETVRANKLDKGSAEVRLTTSAISTAQEIKKKPSSSSSTAAQDKPSRLARAKIIRNALRPLLSVKLAKRDAARAKKAVGAAYSSDFGRVKTNLSQIKDETLKKLVHWYYLRAKKADVSAVDIETFRTANPEWPSQKLMRRRAERALFVKNSNALEIKAFFSNSAPQSGLGLASLAGAKLEEGKYVSAAQLLSKAWTSFKLDEKTEGEILKRMGFMLSRNDHKARADFFLFRDRKRHAEPALRVIKFLNKKDRKQYQARIAILRRQDNAGQLYRAIPKEARKQVGTKFNRIQWLRRQGKDRDARALLKTAPAEVSDLIDVEQWWIERRINCRRALAQGAYEEAYSIATKHGPISGRYYGQAEFLAGWISLRYLKNAKQSERHFLALRAAATSPRERARADYWLGQAAIADKKPSEALKYFRSAAKQSRSYYGQLAAAGLKSPEAKVNWQQPPVPSTSDIEAFQAREPVKAMIAANKAGLEKLIPLFVLHLGNVLENQGELVLLAELARELGQPGLAVRLAAIAMNKGYAFEHYAYPGDALPAFSPLNGNVDKPLLMGLVRQESEFNALAKSRVGARGLMQLMPGTAREVSGKFQIPFESSRLLSSPAYNLQLGSAYLQQLLTKYRGSYILALAAYNAGGGRVDRWVQSFGDPRRAEVDPIDWIERIPFSETRGYVQKILASTQVFRAVLSKGKSKITIMRDINQGRVSGTHGNTLASDGVN